MKILAIVFFLCINLTHAQQIHGLKFKIEPFEPINTGQIFYINISEQRFAGFNRSTFFNGDSISYTIYEPSLSKGQNYYDPKEEINIFLPKGFGLNDVERFIYINSTSIGLLNNNGLVILNLKNNSISKVINSKQSQHFEDAICLNDSIIVLSSSQKDKNNSPINDLTLTFFLLNSKHEQEVNITDFGHFRSFINFSGANRLSQYRNNTGQQLLISSRLQPIIYQLNIASCFTSSGKLKPKDQIKKQVKIKRDVHYSWNIVDSLALDNLLREKENTIAWYQKMAKAIYEKSFIRSLHMLNDSILGVYINLNDSLYNNEFVLINVKDWKKIKMEKFYNTSAEDADIILNDMRDEDKIKVMFHPLTYPHASHPVFYNNSPYFINSFETQHADGSIYIVYKNNLMNQLLE